MLEVKLYKFYVSIERGAPCHPGLWRTIDKKIIRVDNYG